MKVTFKKEPRPTGLWAVGHLYPDTNIKSGGKTFGHISSPSWQTDNIWTVSFAVKKTEPDNNPNCDWKWIHMKEKSATEKDARALVLRIIDDLAKKYTFHFFDKE